MDPPCKIDTDTLSPRNAETQEQDSDNAILSMDPTHKLVLLRKYTYKSFIYYIKVYKECECLTNPRPLEFFRHKTLKQNFPKTSYVIGYVYLYSAYKPV